MKSILIIDDCSDYRSTISDILLDANYDVWEAESPDCAFKILKREEMDLIICDLHMPFTVDQRFAEFEFSYRVGLETIKELTWVYPYKPIIAISAAPPSELRRMSLEIGTVPALNKPFPPGELLSLVQCSLEQGNLLKEIH